MMKRRTFLGMAAGALAGAQPKPAPTPAVLDAQAFRHYIEDCNRTFKEEVVNYIPDRRLGIG